MSWKAFYDLVDTGNVNLDDWQAAIRANPNGPVSALQVTLLTIHDEKNMEALENFCAATVSMLRDKPSKQQGKKR